MSLDGTPLLSVIVVSWNTRDLLVRCLATVTREAAGLPHEALVVDNASADGSADLVAERFPEARLIRNPDNRGFGRACNQGLAHARGRYALLLNPDAELLDRAPERMVDFLEHHPEVGAVGPLLLRAPQEPGLTYGHFPSLTTALLPLLRPLAGWLPGRGDLHALGVVPPWPPAGAPPREVDYASGAALLLRREALAAVGGFDEDYFLYFEETDLCRRLRRAGWRVFYLPSAQVRHREGASREKRSAAALADYYRSLNLYLRKHHSLPYRTLVRAAMIGALGVRYLAARAGSRRPLADYYLASARALRTTAHA